MPISGGLIIFAALAVLVVIILVKTAVVVPQREQFIVERLGKYSRTLDAGFHILFPFIDRVAYRYSMKEQVLDMASQTCITKDNVTVHVDGIIYLQVVDPKLAAYGIEDYRFAATQLAQTTLRSSIGKIELDRTFEEREVINQEVVRAVDEAAINWGAKVLRYEVKDITPPDTVREAMEAQMTAERQKRALIASSEGDRQAQINRAEGQRQNDILQSEGEMQRTVNLATGRAREIELVAQATAEGVRVIATAMAAPGGVTAANLRVAEKYIAEFGNLAKSSTTLIVPQTLSDVAGTVAALMKTLGATRHEQGEDFKIG
jgi:regulator of protease activity HflC (stomatin/prohibitin superfamily)